MGWALPRSYSRGPGAALIFRRLELEGAWLLEPENAKDRQGFFTRNYCRGLLEARDLDPAIVRCEVWIHRLKGAIQGLHYRPAPHGEARLIRCTRGAIHCVAVDLRQDVPTHGRHLSVELSAESRRSFYLPGGFAMGFQTLEDESEVFCQMSELEDEDLERGVRWDDPALGIPWPLSPGAISERDASFPDFVPSHDATG